MRTRSERAFERRSLSGDDEDGQEVMGGYRGRRRDEVFHNRVMLAVAVAACVAAATACVWSVGINHDVAASLLSTVSPVGGHAYRIGVSQLKQLMAVKEPPRALMLARAWNIDAEIQGDCECDRPFDKVTRILSKTIKCTCPYYYVPSEPQFPGEPEPPMSVKYADGCECVRDGATVTKKTTCTCPIQETDEPDFDTYTDKYDPAKVDAETAKKAAEQAKANAAIEKTKGKQEKPPPTKK